MSDRIKHFRAGLLLALSSALLIWPISFWFPLSEYLAALSEEGYVDFKLTLEAIIAIYISFFILNLVNAMLSATKLSYRIKIWLSIVPAIVLLVVPVSLVIPIAIKYPEQSFFEVFGALYRLLRFTSPELVGWVLLLSALAVFLNIRAAISLKGTANPERVPKHLSRRYLIYTGVMLAIYVIITLVSFFNSSSKASDRQACLDFAALATPAYNDQVDAYISNVRDIAEKTGSKDLKSLFIDFSNISTEYLSLVITEPDNETKLAQYGEAMTAVRANIDAICAQVSVK